MVNVHTAKKDRPERDRGHMLRSKSRRLIVLEGTDLDAVDALGPAYAPDPPVGWEVVDEVVRTTRPSTVVLLDPYGGRRAPEAFPRLRDLLRRFPSLTVVAAMPLSPRNLADVGTLYGWGVSEVIDTGPETSPRAVEARLRQAHGRPLKRRLERALPPFLPAEPRNVLLGAAEVAVDGGNAQELARALRCATRTLTERCTRLDLPAPRQVQAWMRILLACMLLDDPGRTVYAAAYACGYSTDRSLRRAMASFLGAGAASLPRGGAFEQAMQHFNAELWRLREDARDRRKTERSSRTTRG